jgi:hypothetical protein
MKTKIILLISLLLIALLAAACGLADEEIVATVDNLSSSQIAGLSATIEALPPQQQQILEDMAVSAGIAPLSPEEKSAVIATVQAARVTATAVGQAVASGERVNATEAPNAAPVIVYFFASAPNQAQSQGGIRYFLNWTTQNANRVEIFGHVMDNPAEGSWPVYNESDNWVLWAANDQVWVEQPLQVQADQNTGATLQNVSVSSRNVTLSFRDPQFVDGDQISVDVNGVRVVSDYITGGRDVSFPVTLQAGANTITVEARNAGVTPPMVTQVTVSNATAGPASQVSGGLNAGERQTFTITAP